MSMGDAVPARATAAEPEEVSALRDGIPIATLGLPWPWKMKRNLVRGDRFYFFAVSPCTFAIGGELLRDGFVLFLGPLNLGWASISSWERREAQAIEARRAETLGSVHESAVATAMRPDRGV